MLLMAMKTAQFYYISSHALPPIKSLRIEHKFHVDWTIHFNVFVDTFIVDKHTQARSVKLCNIQVSHFAFVISQVRIAVPSARS